IVKLDESMIQTIKISEIKFDEPEVIPRLETRQSVGPILHDLDTEIKVLAESIKEQGLLHPITIVHCTNKLITGKKRLLACKLLGMTEIPCEVIENPTEDTILSIHIQENLRRHNLLWYEQIDLERHLND